MNKEKTSGHEDFRVFIKSCDTYDRTRIRRLVEEGMDALGFEPEGGVFVKPNVVFAYDTDTMGTHAFTHPKAVGGALLALSGRPGVSRVDLGENSAMGFPTRFCYTHAGYYDEIRAVADSASKPVGIFCIDEEPRENVFVGGAVHDTLRIPRKMAKAGAKVYLPKLKSHCVGRMTGAVKLNIGICSDDERAIRHDFLLNEKIVDLLSAGYPDFIVMDAIEAGVGNEAFPTPRKLGLLIMGRNPMAVDLVGARLLGLGIDDVPYLKVAADRGYMPSALDDVILSGDVTGLAELDAWATKLLPHDEDFNRWQDISFELSRMKSPMRFVWGPSHPGKDDRCKTGCVMGLKMFLSAMETLNGSAAFEKAKPVVFVVGNCTEQIDARGHEVFFIGSCAKAEVVRAKKIARIDKCFTTTTDMNLAIGHKLGLKSLSLNPRFMSGFVAAAMRASFRKTISGRYVQDLWHFITHGLLKRI